MGKNIADKDTVKRLAKDEKFFRDQELNDIRTVLSNASGRRLMWRLMEKCRTFGSVYSIEQGFTYYNAGQQDIGHFLMSEITEADENLFFKMIRDNKKQQKENK